MDLNEITVKSELRDDSEYVQSQGPDPEASQVEIKEEFAVEGPPVFQCADCLQQMTSLNRFRLHEISQHVHRHHKLQCCVCSIEMSGYCYEEHVLKHHGALLRRHQHQHLLSPKVWTIVKEKEKLKSEEKKAKHLTESYSVEFKADNPWQEILSSVCRKKRSVDAWRVGTIRREIKSESCLGGGTGLNFLPPSYQRPAGNLQQKIDFICSLDLNPRYKQYKHHLKHIKLKKMLISKFASKLSEVQIEKVHREIEKCEAQLDQFSLQSERKTKGKGRDEEITEPGNQTVRPLGNKWRFNGGDNSLPFWSNRSVLRINKAEAPEARKNAERLPFIDLNKTRKIKSEPDFMIAINVPIDDILDHSYVKAQF